MTVQALLIIIIGRLIKRIDNPEYLESSRQQKKDFTRRRKMTFSDYIRFILTSTMRSLASGLQLFSEKLSPDMDGYTKQAFSKGRQRIKPEALKELMELVRDSFYELAEFQTWRGLRVLAVDGTKLNLPISDDLKENYGVQKSSGDLPQALASCLYDTLNGIVLDAQLTRYDGNERELLMQHCDVLNDLKRPSKILGDLITVDRGYPSCEVLQGLERRGLSYVMRCSTEFSQAMKLPQTDDVCDCVILHKFKRASEPMRLRVIRFPLQSGVTEVLLTNLFDEAIKVEDFKALYRLRWTIETSYHYLKHYLQVENFSGLSALAVEQEFFSSLTVANLANVLIFDNREQIDEYNATQNNKYKYKQNYATTVGYLREDLLELLMNSSPTKRAKAIMALEEKAVRRLIPIRDNRSFPRIRKHAASIFSTNKRKA